MKALTATQQKVLTHLTQSFARAGRQPNLHEVAQALGMHYVSLRQHLKALDKKGLLHFEAQGSGRSPIVKLARAPHTVPVLGEIPAGPLSDALAHPEGYLHLPGTPEGYFALYVHGDSMADYLQDGDVVLLRRGLPERSGEICAVRLESDTTLKYLDFRGARPKHFTLRPHNPHYEPVTVPARDITIDGVYRGSLRGDLVRFLMQGDNTMT